MFRSRHLSLIGEESRSCLCVSRTVGEARLCKKMSKVDSDRWIRERNSLELFRGEIGNVPEFLDCPKMREKYLIYLI